jgi:alpha-beta hydrolase superfamily lysophospholipase
MAQAKNKEEKEEAEVKEQALAVQNAAAGDKDAAPCISWTNPIVKPRAVLLCIHGLGLYSGSYQNFGVRMARQGISTYAIDVRGFGSWMKAQGHEEINFIYCLHDVSSALKAIRAANPGLPVFLLGESMGGAIALRAASLFPELIDGLIASVPAGDRFKGKKEDLNVALHFLKGPNKDFDVGKEIINQATDNPQLKKDWEDNPLDRMDLSPKDLMQSQKFMNENHDSVKSITQTPVLMIQGTEDKLVKPTGTWDLFNEIPSVEKTFMAVPSEHLVFEEQQDKKRTFDTHIDHTVGAWILALADESASGKAPLAVRPAALTAAISTMISGDYAQALPGLQKFVQDQPDSSEGQYWLGIAYMKTRKPLLARKAFVAAMSLGNASGHADEANRYLLGMSNDADSQNGSATSAATSKQEPTITHADITMGQPTVVAFYAPWAQQCNNLDSILNQGRAVFGQRIKLIKLNVEDPANKSVVQSFNVGPIPTFIYLSSSGQVTKTEIGRTTFINFAKGVATILKK